MIKSKSNPGGLARPSSANPQEPRRLKTRAALLAAGAELLAQRPIDAIPVNDIVDAAGVAKGSFFNHFPDKDAFAAAVSAEIRAEIEAQVTMANSDVADPARRIARAVSGFIQFARTDPTRARIMLRGHDLTALADNPLNLGVRTDMAAGLESGRLRAGSVATGVIFVTGVCHTLLIAILSSPLTLEGTRVLAANLIVLALTGLGLDQTEAEAIVANATTDVISE